MSGPLLRIENLSLRFGDRAAVDGVSLHLAQGEILALIGESGSGKTLTAQSILQLLPPEARTSGSILFDGKELMNASPATVRSIRGHRIGMIFQEPMSALNPLHQIRDQVVESFRWHRNLHRRAPEVLAKADELMRLVGLDHLTGRGSLYPHQLSGGERQRAMIALAIANDPALLIADEPTTALDVTLQRQILALLKQLQAERNMAMLFISHDLVAVRRFADRVAVMRHGKIVEHGTVAEVFAAPQHDYTKALLSAEPSGTAPALPAAAKEILRTENLTVGYPIKTPVLRRTVGEVKAAADVTIALHEGETLGIVGESGSGKSSLGNAILRLTPARGPIVFLGQRLDRLRGIELRRARRHVQPVFQDPYGSLNPRMEVGELIAEGLRLHEPRTDIAARVDTILNQVGLDPSIKHRYPHEFSGGQRQRIAIARAMILHPSLVVLDEPTSALDLSVQATVLELLKELQREYRTAYLFISHDLRVVRSMAHQVLVLQKGQVVEQGGAQQIFANPQHPYTKKLFTAAFFAQAF